MYGRMDWCMFGCIYVWMDGWMYICMDGSYDGNKIKLDILTEHSRKEYINYNEHVIIKLSE